MKTYTINEIFYSLQGEGVRVGTPNIFIRFSGCNETCAIETHGFDCDTEFVSGRKLALDEILVELAACGQGCKAVILTGGEPSLQVDAELVSALKSAGYFLAVETNGSKELPAGIDWICVSPKSAEHTLRQLTANEVKYVRAYGQGIPKSSVQADYKLISPAFQGTTLDPKTLAWCIKLVEENPQWRLSVQQHKFWRIR
ncbi:4Fe-4S cluster-binding domain-containing protein [bacterium]|nr:4Fe-4S cluster-binding domain-containing protein [bacterium]